jgi:Integrase core domain
VESFNGQLRDECLNEHLFANLNQARQIIEEWRIDYNTKLTAHEPQRTHTNRVRNPPQPGQRPEQTLLINEGKQGSRSRCYPEQNRQHGWSYVTVHGGWQRLATFVQTVGDLRAGRAD